MAYYSRGKLKVFLGGGKMKRVVFIIFILFSINIIAENTEPNHMMKHHQRHYMKQMNDDLELTEEQRVELTYLRMEFMERERKINRRLREIRAQMNHCMMEKDEQDVERYRNLRDEREDLRRERRSLKEAYKENYIEIIKKQ